MRADEATLAHIARVLKADDVPTAQGGRCWYPSTVRAVLHGQDASRPMRSMRRGAITLPLEAVRGTECRRQVESLWPNELSFLLVLSNDWRRTHASAWPGSSLEEEDASGSGNRGVMVEPGKRSAAHRMTEADVAR